MSIPGASTSYTSGIRRRGYHRVPTIEEDEEIELADLDDIDLEQGLLPAEEEEVEDLGLTVATEAAAETTAAELATSALGTVGAVAGIVGGAAYAWNKAGEQYEQIETNSEKWIADLQKKWQEKHQIKERIDRNQERLEHQESVHRDRGDVLTRRGWISNHHKDHNRGIVPPPFQYLGPGNSLSGQKPYNEVDEHAREHDIAYQQHPGNVREADNIFKNKLKDHLVEGINQQEHPGNVIGAALGYAGISAKNIAEDLLNKQLYPKREYGN